MFSIFVKHFDFKFECSNNNLSNNNIDINQIIYYNMAKNQLIKTGVLMNKIFLLFFDLKLLSESLCEKPYKTYYNPEVLQFIEGYFDKDLKNNQIKINQNISSKNNELMIIEKNQEIILDNTLVNVCLNNLKHGDIKEKNQYKQNLIRFQKDNAQFREIIRFYLYNTQITKEIEDNPLILIKKLEIMIDTNQYLDAAEFLKSKRSIFLNCKNEVLLKEIIYLQMFLMRYHFGEGNFDILCHIATIDFSVNLKDDAFRAKFLLLSASSCIGCYLFKNAIDSLNIIYGLNCKNKQKAKAAFLLGMVYEYLYEVERNTDYLKLSNHWLSICSRQMYCLWSLLSMSYLKTKPKIISIYDINCISNKNKGDQSLLRAKELWIQGKYKSAIKHIHDLKVDDFVQFSPTFIDTLKFFIEQKNKAAMYKIGCLCFKMTGKIIKECFGFPWYISAAIQQNIITTYEAIELMSIASEESKFLDHQYYNLDTPYGLGIFQINPTEIKKLAIKLRVIYNKREFLNNPLLQVKFAITLFRYQKNFVGNNMMFALFYFVSGHKAYVLQEKTSYLKQKHPLYSTVIMAHIISGRTRRYLVSVIEFMILQHFVIYGTCPNLNHFL